MAVPLHLTGGASLNCATKVFSTGFKSQSTSLFSSSTPNLTDEFYQKVNTGLQIRSRKKRTGGRVSLMPMRVPYVPYRGPGQRQSQWIDLWNAFYRERVIFIGRAINEEYSNYMLATLLYLDTLASDEPIILYINSPGGDLHPCLSLYDTMQSLQTSVATYCLNLAGDVAGFMLAAGEKGKRISMPLATVDIRSPMGFARGRADDVQIEAQELLRIRDYLFNEFAKHTGQPVEKVYEDLSRTKRFRAKEAIEYGIIDRCVKSVKEEKEPPKDGSSASKSRQLRGFRPFHSI